MRLYKQASNRKRVNMLFMWNTLKNCHSGYLLFSVDPFLFAIIACMMENNMLKQYSKSENTVVAVL